ncbi:MAG: cyclic pyranopterin monophosphate synthase MoaC [Kordiimonas sp.]|nr:cyclic pyranopterin monophosphate synthase MoaC [Kordiimonas sp.]|tara:strand:+ start:728 stop:1213 length:486 start_codon:yes stop_codon:yes gene_type:complete
MTEQKPLSHIGDDGKARMVDVSKKAETHRIATAKGRIYMQPETLNLIQDGGMAKGDVFSVARIAGIMAAKQTGTLIPLCHPLPLQNIQIDFTLNHDENYIEITASASLVGRTGIEMEALSAVSIAGLTIYDMCKAADKTMKISDIRLTYKSGGKSGIFQAD